MTDVDVPITINPGFPQCLISDGEKSITVFRVIGHQHLVVMKKRGNENAGFSGLIKHHSFGWNPLFPQLEIFFDFIMPWAARVTGPEHMTWNPMGRAERALQLVDHLDKKWECGTLVN